MAEFRTDEHGNIMLMPMVGWELRHIAGTLMIVGIEYTQSQQELEIGITRTLPLVLQPALARDFGEALKKQANKLLTEIPPGTPLH